MNKEILTQRINHLMLDQMLLSYSESYLETDEQRAHFVVQTKMLADWLSELREELENHV